MVVVLVGSVCSCKIVESSIQVGGCCEVLCVDGVVVYVFNDGGEEVGQSGEGEVVVEVYCVMYIVFIIDYV